MRDLVLGFGYESQIGTVEPILLVYEELVVLCMIVHHRVESHLRVEYC